MRARAAHEGAELHERQASRPPPGARARLRVARRPPPSDGMAGTLIRRQITVTLAMLRYMSTGS